MSNLQLRQANQLSIGSAQIESTGEELVFRSDNGEEVTLKELLMIRDFIEEDSSLREEWREFKLFRTLRE